MNNTHIPNLMAVHIYTLAYHILTIVGGYGVNYQIVTPKHSNLIHFIFVPLVVASGDLSRRYQCRIAVGRNMEIVFRK